MCKPYSKGIYRGIGGQYDYKNKDRNVQHMIAYMLNRTPRCLNMRIYRNDSVAGLNVYCKSMALLCNRGRW